MDIKIIMPMGTASWLIKNTNLDNRQIADFCKITIRDIIDIRNNKIQICPVDPIHYTQQLTIEEIERCLKDPQSKLKIIEENYDIFGKKVGKAPKEKAYMPTKLRKEKKIGVLTMLKIYPMISDKDIHFLMNVSAKTVANYRANWEEHTKVIQLSENVETFVSLNPFWKSIKEKYKIK